MELTGRSLDTVDGLVAYEVGGPPEGPLAVCLPGMGDLAAAYRFVAEALLARGWRVALMDLPGHGASQAGARPSQLRIGEYAAALVAELGGPAVVVGHSYTPDSALVAAQGNHQVLAAVCLAPWATAPRMSFPMRLLSDLVARWPWAWGAYYRSLHKQPPADLPMHVRAVRAALRRPDGTATIRRMAAGEGKDAADRREATSCPVVVVMGDRDPDFNDPAAEAAAFAEPCGGRVVMAAGAGHYPHAETPDVVVAAILEVAREVGVVAPGGMPPGEPRA